MAMAMGKGRRRRRSSRGRRKQKKRRQGRSSGSRREVQEAIPSGLRPRSKRAATLLSQTEQESREGKRESVRDRERARQV